MMFPDAQGALQQFLSPLTLDEFLDATLVGGFRKIDASPLAPRTALLGPDPAALLLGAHHLAAKVTFHSANPSGPAPALADVSDAAEFRRRVEQLQSRNYSVRFPELRPLSAPLDALARALEMLLHQPVTTSAFWSRGGMRAPVHYDDHDLLVVQLRGRKRWFISHQPSQLTNTWHSTPAAALELGPHATLEVQPGELVYLPRGTLHSVDSDSESLHVSIGFTPLTVREALGAALDHPSDLDQRLRSTVGGRIAFQLRGAGLEPLGAAVTDAAARLAAACRAPGFLESALHSRSARAVAALSALSAPPRTPALTLDTELRPREAAFCHLTASPERIDFSYPGGHLYVHRGAQQSLEYMVNTPRFRVRDVPGGIDAGARLSLATRLVEIGYLEPVSDDGPS